MPTNANPSPTEIVAALQRGGIVEALKLVLAAKRAGSSGGNGLAGQAARRSEPFKPAHHPSKVSELSPGEVPRSNGDVWLLLLVLAALCIMYFFLAR
jgi:hypothetical protein